MYGAEQIPVRDIDGGEVRSRLTWNLEPERLGRTRRVGVAIGPEMESDLAWNGFWDGIGNGIGMSSGTEWVGDRG